VLSRDRDARRIQDDIRQVLLNDWDPVGSSGCDLCADEYDAYVGGVYSLLANRASVMEIAVHLARLEVDAMGLPSLDPARLLPVAEKLTRLDVRLRGNGDAS
jgi:hypothetical protein